MTAGLAVGLAQGLSRAETLRLAAAAGSLNVTRHGLATGQLEAIRLLARRVELRPGRRRPRREKRRGLDPWRAGKLPAVHNLLSGAGWGVAAGAAGTTALNAVTYLDMAARARPASTTPEDTVEEAAQVAGVRIPGEADARANRLRGLGPLVGTVAGVSTGAVLGVAWALGLRPRYPIHAAVATVAALVAANAPMAGLGVTDWRQWSAKEWVADIVPHLAFGAVAASVISHGRARTDRRA